MRRLVGLQLEFGHAETPPEDVHALELDQLDDPAITVFAARAGGEVLAIGALRRLDSEHAELKAMHTAEGARGRGIGGAMLSHLLAAARGAGYRRVSLETGSMASFAPARALYVGAGFTPCEPFGEYVASDNSVYLTIELAPAG